MKVGIVVEMVEVGLEEGIVDSIEPGQYRQQMPVGQGGLGAGPPILVIGHQIARARQPGIQLCKGLEHQPTCCLILTLHTIPGWFKLQLLRSR